MTGSRRLGSKALLATVLLVTAPLGCVTLPADLLNQLLEEAVTAVGPKVFVNLQIDAEQEDVDGLTAITDEFQAPSVRPQRIAHGIVKGDPQ
jgi:hypothetical protein